MSKVNRAVPMPRFARNFDSEKENAPPSRGAQFSAKDVSVTGKSKQKRIIPFFGEPKPQDAQALNTAKLPRRTPFNVLCSERNKQTEAVDACKAKSKSDLKPVNVLRIAKTSKIGQSGPNETTSKKEGSGLNGATQYSWIAKAKESGSTGAISMREPVRPRLFSADQSPPEAISTVALEVQDSGMVDQSEAIEVISASTEDQNCAHQVPDRQKLGVSAIRLGGKVITPSDGPPPAPLMPIKELVRRSRIQRRVCLEPTPPHPFPAELVYHLEYRDDLLQVELAKESRTWTLSDTFLRKHINASQRKQVVAYLIHLGTHCRYPSFVIYQTVKLFDVAMDRFQVSTARIQLTALAALWICLKRQQIYAKIPSAATVISLAKELYVGREDLLMLYERKILRSLNFDISFTDVHSLITFYILTYQQRARIPEETAMVLYNCAAFMVDLTLLDEYFCRVPPSRVAFTAVELALILVIDCASKRTVDQKRGQYWRSIFTPEPLPYERSQERARNSLRSAMIRGIRNSRNKRSGYDVVFKKYQRSRYGQISTMLLERAKKLSWPDQPE